jgi:hypothetical protein
MKTFIINIEKEEDIKSLQSLTQKMGINADTLSRQERNFIEMTRYLKTKRVAENKDISWADKFEK